MSCVIKNDRLGKVMFKKDCVRAAEKDVSEIVREIRFALGLTQEQFAAKLGVTFPTVNRWENQKTLPSPLALQKLKKLSSILKKKNRKAIL